MLWQGHAIQVENNEGTIQNIGGGYSIGFSGNNEVEGGEIEMETKPKVEKKAAQKRKKKMGADSESDDDVADNRLEDNPTQVNIDSKLV